MGSHADLTNRVLQEAGFGGVVGLIHGNQNFYCCRGEKKKRKKKEREKEYYPNSPYIIVCELAFKNMYNTSAWVFLFDVYYLFHMLKYITCIESFLI